VNKDVVKRGRKRGDTERTYCISFAQRGAERREPREWSGVDQ
jgi:hypothetical protein